MMAGGKAGPSQNATSGLVSNQVQAPTSRLPGGMAVSPARGSIMRHSAVPNFAAPTQNANPITLFNNADAGNYARQRSLGILDMIGGQQQAEQGPADLAGAATPGYAPPPQYGARPAAGGGANPGPGGAVGAGFGAPNPFGFGGSNFTLNNPYQGYWRGLFG